MLRSDLALPASPSWTKNGARREASGPFGRAVEPQLLEHRLLGLTNDSQSGSVSMWQECASGVVWCALVLSPST
eukprot:5970518-Alexandrium_andersonii.AAC.1